MNTNAESEFKLQFSHKKMIRVSLLVVLLFASLIIGVFMTKSGGVSLENAVHVKNEEELRNAVNNAPSRGIGVIALGNDISLSSNLIIPTHKDITLTSNKANGYYKLIGAPISTITVESGGVLKIDGIIITNSSQSGVIVKEKGLFILYSGEISGNNAYGYMVGIAYGFILRGGGVYNNGTFEMHGGKISNNYAHFSASGEVVGEGGGVYNMGTFKMYGGEILNNFVQSSGGGVYNGGTFTMSGGTISNNGASYSGGGVFNRGTFDRSGGTISNNSPSDVTDYGNNETSNGNGGSSNNNEASNGNNNGSSNGNYTESNGNNDLSNTDGFSLRNVVIICVSVTVVLACVVMIVLFFTSKVELKHTEEIL